MGGPIRRDKTFYFANYEGGRQATPVTTLNTVPTDAQRLGDFSSTYDRNGALTIVFDPVTTRPDPARPGRYIRDAFSGLSTEDLMFDYRPYHYEGYLRTSPLAEAEAQIKANLARSKK